MRARVCELNECASLTLEASARVGLNGRNIDILWQYSNIYLNSLFQSTEKYRKSYWDLLKATRLVRTRFFFCFLLFYCFGRFILFLFFVCLK